ncbi:MAG: co-chaperone DjlA [Bdellovibrio bacteriovorus]
MGWLGKALGGAVGLALGGPVGALIGALVGHGLDRGAARADLFGGARVKDPARLQERFLETTFAVMGHLAKSDGRVSEQEIAYAESVMGRMGLSPALRRAAILFFGQGKTAAFELLPALTELRQAGLGQGALRQIFLEVQMGAAYADGDPTPTQREILERIRHALQVPAATFARVERLILLQQRVLGGAWGRGGSDDPGSTGRGPGTGGSRTGSAGTLSLAGAYATLGVEPGASETEVKRAYRRLMNRHHPDKLIARGAPEEALKLASQRTQEIRRAYETITRARAA